MGHIMRLEKPQLILRLALRMQGSSLGVSLGDIEEEFDVSRRTAERMRDAVIELFPDTYLVASSEKHKRWRIPPSHINDLVNFSTENFAALNTAANILERESLTTQSAAINEVIVRLTALMKRNVMRRIDPDLSAIIEAEGYAMRPGPKPFIKVDVFDTLRRAITACEEVDIKYYAKTSSHAYSSIVYPYGFLYGSQQYLIAWNTYEEAQGMRLFRLSKIENVTPTGKSFVRDASFSLKEYSRKSFGVFQGNVIDVVWKVSSESAKEAKEYIFHPEQKLEEQDDGSLIIKFSAAGSLEMCWHLFTWGGRITVVQPAGLAEQLKALCHDVINAQTGLAQ